MKYFHIRGSRLKILCEKAVLKFIGKHLWRGFFKSVGHKCFPWNFAKLLRTVLLLTISERLAHSIQSPFYTITSKFCLYLFFSILHVFWESNVRNLFFIFCATGFIRGMRLSQSHWFYRKKSLGGRTIKPNLNVASHYCIAFSRSLCYQHSCYWPHSKNFSNNQSNIHQREEATAGVLLKSCS